MEGCSQGRHPKHQKCDLRKKFNEIRRGWYQNVPISNTIPKLHYTLMSRDYDSVLRNYFSTINLMRPVINRLIQEVSLLRILFD